VPRGNAVPGYISVLVFEWLLVLYVRMGVHKRGVRLRDLVGGRWTTPEDVMKDVALGAGLWALWIGLMNPHILGGGTNAAHQTVSKPTSPSCLEPALPTQTTRQRTEWNGSGSKTISTNCPRRRWKLPRTL
jgi:hypothetical protein